jgi:hypothetical protein
MLTDFGPVELWATRQRRPSCSGKSTGLFVPPSQSLKQFVRTIAEQAPLAVPMRKARSARGGSEYHLVRGFSAPFLQAALQCPQPSVRVDTGALSLQPLQ